MPDVVWRSLVSSFGYSVGFIMVVLSRQQFFTENTLTVVLPVMAEPTPRNFALIARIWTIVLLANLTGTLLAAVFCTFTPVLTPELRDAMIEISRKILGHGWVDMFFKGISAGFLIAAMVWIIPSANTAQFPDRDNLEQVKRAYRDDAPADQRVHRGFGVSADFPYDGRGQEMIHIYNAVASS